MKLIEHLSKQSMKRFVQEEDSGQVTLLPERLDGYVSEENAVRVIDAL